MEPVLELSGVVKTFGRTRALDGLDLRVDPGQVHAFLGPNGAGKSTAIRVLLGLLRPDSGSATLLGGDPWADAPTLHRRLAYVLGDVSLWPNLTGGEVIDLLGRLRGGTSPQRRAELLQRFDLDPSKKARTYSKGNRQKVALVAALASDAELLLLDEPTSGLDPLMEQVFRDVVRERVADGATVLLSSHILSEVEALAGHVSIIRAGRVVDSGTLEELRHLQDSQLTVRLRHAPPPDLALFGARTVTVDGRTVTAALGPEHLDTALTDLGRYGIDHLTCTPPTLEDLFLAHYQDAAR